MAKPMITRDRVLKILAANGVDLKKAKVCLVGIRGYYRDTMGKKGKNDIGMFDDGFVWIDETDMASFNGNTDPSRYYKNVATLKTGLWTYKKGKHGISKPGGGYAAFRQAKGVVVQRWQKDDTFKDTPLGDTINIHRGGASTTSSAGCQTLPPAQWDAFKAYGYMLIDRHKVATFPYLLVENDGSIA